MTTNGDTRTNCSGLPKGSNLKRQLQRTAEAVTAALYPPRCILCGASTPSLDPLCSPCRERLPALAGPRCQRCGKQIADAGLDLCITCGTQRRLVDQYISLGPYDGPWGTLLRTLKFEREPAIARFLGKMAAAQVAQHDCASSIDHVTYVPMHRRARRLRGFNQAQILAGAIGRALDLPVVRVLRKIRATQPQARLSAGERRANLKGAFRALRCEGEHVLLVDDICTTGSTLEACAQALKQEGTRCVTAVTVARA